MKYYIVFSYNDTNCYDKPDYGYYCGYKDKLSDHYSYNYIDAKRYKHLGTAITNRLHIPVTKEFPVKKIVNAFEQNEYLIRQKKLARINGEEYTPCYDHINVFKTHRVDILEVNGNTIKLVGKVTNNEIYKYFKGQEKRISKKVYEPLKVDVEDADLKDNFWD